MNRTTFILWLLLLCAVLLAGGIVLAHGTHPVSDNMCGAHSYGNCYTDDDWVRGWYAFLVHGGTTCTSTVTENCYSGSPAIGGSVSYVGNANVPAAEAVPTPQTRGSSRNTCYVQNVAHIAADGIYNTKCVSETKFWCDERNKHPAGSAARAYVESTMPSSISC